MHVVFRESDKSGPNAKLKESLRCPPNNLRHHGRVTGPRIGTSVVARSGSEPSSRRPPVLDWGLSALSCPSLALSEASGGSAGASSCRMGARQLGVALGEGHDDGVLALRLPTKVSDLVAQDLDQLWAFLRR